MAQLKRSAGMLWLLVGLLTGCGRPIGAPLVLPARTQAAALSAHPAPLVPVASTSVAPAPSDTVVPAAIVPTAAELAKLEVSSPDELTLNAPPEPGMSAEGLWPTPPNEDLGNFGKVEDTLWRGARPTDLGLAKLAGMGVKTIVNLENDATAVEHERTWALAHGLKFVSIPLSIITPPKQAKIQQFLDLARDPANRPLYFHCMQGSDRTGTAAFCYRLSYDHWVYSKAYAEMVAYKFHTYLLGLRGFLVWYANNPLPVDTAPARVSQMTTGNAAKLYVSPVETLPAVKNLIQNARRSIYFEAFCLGNDSYGQQLFPLFEAKARSGVEVKLLLDEAGSHFLKGYEAMLTELQQAGVVVLSYKTTSMVDSENHQSINITHRKVYLVDGDEALVGGVNLHSPFDTTTQDLLIDWQGPVVADLYDEFGRDWMAAGGTPLAQAPVSDAATGTVTAQVAVTSPAENRFEARNAIFAAVDNSKQEILIEQQYLWDDQLVAHLVQAGKRGVHLRILLPNGEQKMVQRYLNGQAALQLVAAGAQVRFYKGVVATAHLHTKYFAVDDAWATTGSVNGDTRSLIDNQELDILTTDSDLIGQLRQRLFERDWGQNSQPFDFQPPNWLEKQLYNFLEAIDYYF